MNYLNGLHHPGAAMIRLRFVPAFLSTMTVLLGLTAVQSGTFAQETPRRAPEAFEAGLTPAAGGLPSEIPLVAGPCDRDYWVVSTWDCDQKAKGPCVGCRFGYHRCAPDGTPCRFDRAAFESWLRPGVPLCVIIHGSYTNENIICDEIERQYQWLRAAAGPLPMQFVFFAWPSGSLFPVPNPDIWTLGCRSTVTGIYLAQWIAQLPPETPVSLMGYSTGARTIATALHLLGGGEVTGYSCPSLNVPARRLRAVLVTAALDRHWIVPGQRYGQALCPAELVIYLRNRSDWVLNSYHLRRPFARRALGQAGLTPEHRAALGPCGARLFEWDVTSLVGPGHMWPNYVRHPQLAASLVPVLGFVDAEGP
jgi:hypothetical protein